MAEYESFPIWREDSHGVTNLAPEDLGLPEALASDLTAWALRYEEMFDMSDPLRSGFADRTAEDDFYYRGLVLARRLGDVLGDRAEVYSFDGRTGQSHLV